MSIETVIHSDASPSAVNQPAANRQYTNPVNIFCLDSSYRYLYYNDVHRDAVLKAWGAKINRGSSLLDMIQQQDDRDVIRCNLDRALAGETVKEIKKYGELKNYWETLYSPMYDPDGQIAGVNVVSTNITEQKKKEEKLQNSIDISPGLIAIANIESGYFIECNQAVTSMLGHTVEEFTSRPLIEFIHPDDRQKTAEEITRQLKGSTTTNFQNRYLCKDGSFTWLSWQGTAADKNGLIYAVATDISDLKRSEFFVKQTAGILEMIALGESASSIYDAIALMYEARHPGMRCSMLELRGGKLMHGGAPSLPKAYCEAVNGLEYGPSVGSCGTSTFTGKRVLVEDIATDEKWAKIKHVALPHGLRCCWSEPIKSSKGDVLGAFGMYYNHPALPNALELLDLESAGLLAGIVMEREHREAKLRTLSQAIEQAGESVMITDRHGTIEYVNPAFTDMTGFSAEEVLGNNPRMLKSGNQSDEYYTQLWQTISKGEIWNSKLIDQRKDGSHYPAIMSIFPIFNEEGEITHYAGIQQDMTEHQLLEEQFRQSQKMEALGTLVGGIAHDFNNMLAGMTGNIYLAKRHAREHPEILKKLVNVEHLSFRAANMIQQLLTFARKERVSMKHIPFTAFIKETLKLLHSSVPENIVFSQDICTDRLIINGDGTMIHQILLNLINNACDALEWRSNPCIHITLETIQIDKALSKKHAGYASGSYAHLSVKDNGSGIPKDNIEHLFEPFFSTKDPGKGTGLGLAMVFGAVESHHGHIEVESIEDEGTDIHIYLPLIHSEAGDDLLHPEEQTGDTGEGETILLVDDQSEVRNTGREVLESLNYRILIASNGAESVEIYKENAESIDLVIMDIVMPVMNGDEAVRHIRAINADVKVIFSTGYDKDMQSELAEEVVVNKPFNVIQMSQMMRKMLTKQA